MAELDNHKQNIKDLAETRKIKQSDDVGGAGTTKTEYVELKPVTFKEKWDNYWYHYKIPTIVGVLVLAFTIASVREILIKPPYDAGLAFVTETPFDSNSQFIAKEWEELCVDQDGDEEINLKVFTAQLDVYNKYTLDAAMAEANVTKFMGNIAVMGSFLYVVDEIGYNSLLEVDCILQDLSDLVGEDTVLEVVDRYPLKDTKLAQKVGIGSVLDNMYLCMISYDDLPQGRQDDEAITLIWEKDLAFIKNLIDYN